ncbi:MAG: transposase [Chitinophagales bacterium]
MSTKQKFTSSTTERTLRRFSENFKKQKVQEIQLGRSTVLEISKQYEVTTTNVYRWISKFGSMKSKKERVIVETDSDTKELLALKKKIADLERIIGQKQILLDFKDKMIELAEQTYQVDIKKKFSTKQSGTTTDTDTNTPSV